MTSRTPIEALNTYNPARTQEKRERLLRIATWLSTARVGRRGRQSVKPWQTAVKAATKVYLDLADELLDDENFTYLAGGRLTQDCVENLFSQCRRVEKVPTALHLRAILKKMLVTQYLEIQRPAAYEGDEAVEEWPFLEYLRAAKRAGDLGNDDSEEEAPEPLTITLRHDVDLSDVEMQPLMAVFCYVASVVAEKEEIVDCVVCQEALIAAPGEEVHAFSHLVDERERHHGAFRKCTVEVRDLLITAEKCLRAATEQVAIQQRSLERICMTVLAKHERDELPVCHFVPQKLVRVYLKVRMFAIGEFSCDTFGATRYASKSVASMFLV